MGRVVKLSELSVEDRKQLADKLPLMETYGRKSNWNFTEMREAIRSASHIREGLLHGEVLDLLRKKKEEVTRIGTPVAINKGKLIDELIADVQKLLSKDSINLPKLSE